MEKDPEGTEIPLASKSTPLLDYGRPPARRPRYLVGAILISLGWYVWIDLTYSEIGDLGVRKQRVDRYFLVYAMAAAFILIRRVRNPTWVDLTFIAFGYPILVFVMEKFH